MQYNLYQSHGNVIIEMCRKTAMLLQRQNWRPAIRVGAKLSEQRVSYVDPILVTLMFKS